MRALMLAVFEDAVRCYLSGSGRIRAEADEWVHSLQRHSPFSFIVVCETLGLDPPAVRSALHRIRDAQLPPTAAIGRARPNARRTRQAGDAPSLAPLTSTPAPDAEAWEPTDPSID
jgi:hypothetical protein